MCLSIVVLAILSHIYLSHTYLFIYFNQKIFGPLQVYPIIFIMDFFLQIKFHLFKNLLFFFIVIDLDECGTVVRNRGRIRSLVESERKLVSTKMEYPGKVKIVSTYKPRKHPYRVSKVHNTYLKVHLLSFLSNIL